MIAQSYCLTLGAIEHDPMDPMALHDGPVPSLTLGAIEHDPMDPMAIHDIPVPIILPWGYRT